jgi:hypothetical protein
MSAEISFKIPYQRYAVDITQVFSLKFLHIMETVNRIRDKSYFGRCYHLVCNLVHEKNYRLER